MPCKECGANVACEGRLGLERARTDAVYCSDACRDEWVSRDASQRMAKTNRTHASARMRANNPMSRPEIREKVSRRLKEIGHRPPLGGNGRGPTVPQQLLADALGWPMEVSVATGTRPPAYKVDIGNEALKLAIEVDGPSHNALKVRAADERKTAILRGLGWSVLRFKNSEVLTDLNGCLSTISKWKARTRTSSTTGS